MITVQSSNLASVGYNPWSGTLTIEFHGGRVYQYFNVPFAVYLGLMTADSHGSYFAANIRDQYQFRRIR
ncbi:MAG TPA: KTSC domain-containing protein [Candidatus Eisenbacteria bacterium]|nr:KTSC domain-containing protein [Candidatus Eisenbacteria bacterium]